MIIRADISVKMPNNEKTEKKNIREEPRRRRIDKDEKDGIITAFRRNNDAGGAGWLRGRKRLTLGT
jgi:DNA-binding Lrp family transcriptional regulator